MQFAGEKRDTSCRNLETQHTFDKSGDRRSGGSVSSTRRIPRRL